MSQKLSPFNADHIPLEVYKQCILHNKTKCLPFYGHINWFQKHVIAINFIITELKVCFMPSQELCKTFLGSDTRHTLCLCLIIIILSQLPLQLQSLASMLQATKCMAKLGQLDDQYMHKCMTVKTGQGSAKVASYIESAQ